MAGRRDIYEKALNDGISFTWDQQWDKAIAAYRAALDEFPDDPVVLANLGLALLALNKQKEALAIYQRAARVSPGDPVPVEKCAELLEGFGQVEQAAQAYFAVGELYVGRRDIDKAIENWTRAALLVPNNLNAQSRLAVAYERMGKTPEAIAAYIEMARLLQVQGDIPKAMQAVQRAAQLDPQNADAARAFSMMQRGEILPEPRRASKGGTGMLRRLDAFAAPEPEPHLKEKITTDKKFNPFEQGRQMALSMLAESLFDLEDTSEASEPIPQTQTGFLRLGAKKEAKANRAQLIGYVTQGIELQAQNELTGALELFEKAAQGGMDNPALYYTIAADFMDQENYEKAIKYLTVVAKNPTYAGGAFYGLGMCYGRTDLMNEAIDSLLSSLRAIDLTTVPPTHTVQLNRLYETFIARMKQENPTEDDLMRVGENLIAFLSGRDWEQRVKVSREQLNKQKNGQLAPLAEVLLIPGADRIMESMSLIESYLAQGWLQSAMDEAQRAIETSPLYLPIHHKMAEILIKENRIDAAVAKYTVLASLYNVRGEGHMTTEIYEQIARLAPMDLNARAKLIEILNSQGKVAEAIQQYAEMAQAYYDLADLDGARKTYAQALTLAQQPNVKDRSLAVKVLLRMGDIDMQRLDWRQAMVTYAQVKNLDASNEIGRAMLVSLYLRTGQPRQAMAETDEYLKTSLARGEVAKVVTFLETVIRDHPEEVSLRSRLARIYQEMGKKAQAISQLDAIGEAYMQGGNRAEAIKTIQSIIALAPDNVADYQKLLQEMQAG